MRRHKRLNHNRVLKNKHIACLALSYSALSAHAITASGQAFAEESAEPPAQTNVPQLETIIVTASRRESSVQDTEYNVSAVSGEKLLENGIGRPEDLAKIIAGISVTDGGGRFRNPISIRGIGSPGTAPSDFFTTEATAYYVDETPFEYLNLRILDVERVEVLRGPQGTLYGAGALGGVIRYILNEPDSEGFSANLSTRVGFTKDSSGVGQDTTVVFNLPIAQDRLALRLVGNYVEQSGFMDYVTYPNEASAGFLENRTHEDSNQEELMQLRATLGWDVSEDWKIKLSYASQQQDTEGRPAFTLNTLNPNDELNRDFVGRDAYSGFHPEFSERDFSLFSFDMRGSLGWADATLSASMHEDDYFTQADITRFLEALFGGYYLPFDELNGYDDNVIDTETTTAELRLQSPSTNTFDWTIGAFYMDQKRGWSLLEHTPGLNEYIWGADTSVPPNDFNLDQHDDYSQFAFYGEATMHLNDRFRVTGGARYFKEESEIDLLVWYPIYSGLDGYDDPADAATDQGSGGSFDDVHFKVNLSYDLSEDLLTYFTFSQGFRRGGSNPIPGVQAGDVKAELIEQVRFYEPDTLDNYEIGVKSSFFNNRMSANAAFYRVDWNDLHGYKSQVKSTNASGEEVSVGLPISFRTNTGDAVSQGFELDLNALVAEGFELGAGLAYNTIEAKGTTQFQEDGDKVSGKPKWQGYATGTYSWTLASGLLATANLLVSYRDELDTNDGGGSAARPADTRANLDAYVLVDGFVGLESDTWSLRLFADNLLDEDAEVAFATSQGMRRVYVNRPFTIGVAGQINL